MSEHHLIVTAAGQSRRFPSKRGKLMEHLNGDAILFLTLRACLQFPFDTVTVVTQYKWNAEIEAWWQRESIPTPLNLVEGGDTRQKSVENGVRSIQTDGYVWIHDAARPNVSTELLSRLHKKSETDLAIIPGISVTDTIKQVDKNGTVVKTIPRDYLVRIQTPQVFKQSTLLAAYESLAEDTEYTDEAMIIEASGELVRVVQGDPENIKVTYPEDLDRLRS